MLCLYLRAISSLAVTCSPGTYGKNHGCEKCPVGFYHDLKAQVSSKACPPGFMSVDVGMEHATECNGELGSSRKILTMFTGLR